MTTLKRFDPGAQNDWIFDAVARDGAAIVEGVLNRPMLQALRDELGPDIEAGQPGSLSGNARVQDFHGAKTKRICSLARRSDAFVDLMLHPLLLALCRSVFAAGLPRLLAQHRPIDDCRAGRTGPTASSRRRQLALSAVART